MTRVGDPPILITMPFYPAPLPIRTTGREIPDELMARLVADGWELDPHTADLDLYGCLVAQLIWNQKLRKEIRLYKLLSLIPDSRLP